MSALGCFALIVGGLVAVCLVTMVAEEIGRWRARRKRERLRWR